MQPLGTIRQLWFPSPASRYSHPLAAASLETTGRAMWGNGVVSRDAAAATTREGGVGQSRTEETARLEAVLFLAQNPLTSRKLAQLAALADGTKARTLVRTLNRFYDAEASAFRVEEVAGGYQLLTRAKFAPWLRRFSAAADEVRLSAPALETLAVVAYRQPVLRAEIEAIRGVQCDEVLRQLIERDLVRVVGRSEELGRPLLYGTTRWFLQIFGLRHLDELPRAEILRQSKLSDFAAAADNQTLTPHDSPIAEEEITVKSLVKHNPTEEELAFQAQAAVALTERAAKEEDDDFKEEEEFEDDEDFEDDFDDDEDLDDDEEEEDLDDEDDDTWEEVEDDDLDEDEDDDWDDEDDDWDDDDDDWDDDEEEKGGNDEE